MASRPLTPGPIIPGRPVTPRPVAPTQPVARYIPAGAAGKTLTQQAAANKAAVKQGIVPKPTNVTQKPTTKKKTTTTKKPDTGGSSKTGSIEQGSLEDQLGLDEVLAMVDIEGTSAASTALRKFQGEQAKRQLADALKEIDRAAIEGYKGISEDYAARGLQRSGSYMGAESRAMAGTTRAKAQANEALTDLLNQLNLEQAAENEALAREKQRILAGFIQSRLAAGGFGK